MTEHISTEEAERIEGELETDHLIYWDPEFRCSKYTRDSLAVARGALRSLAAERDGLRVALRRILGVANTWDHATEAHIARDALWKERDD